ncbi:DUF2871 family protein [Brevibacterium otitidis]|uniref:DUF2871 family protein n=1 Tax=Brevibacterium otitidis TaxID=53364 RepID=A0ABV5WZ79_9MICO
MTALLRAATTYLILGLAAGLYYREFTKANDFPPASSPSSRPLTPTCWRSAS